MLRTSDAWKAAVNDPSRLIDYRVEAVDMTGAHLQDVDVKGVRVSFDGDQGEAWQAGFEIADRALVPMSPMDILDGRSGTRLRVWWRLWTSTGWEEVPVGTFIVEDPEILDGGTPSITVPGLDPLAIVRRSGYEAAIPVGGKTVSEALTLFFEALALGYPVSIEPSTATIAAGKDLWENDDPLADARDLAALAGQDIRTDRWGVITVARTPDPATALADWQEGSTCPITSMKVRNRTSNIPRKVVVTSTSPDVTPAVTGVWTNPDADARNLLRVMRIQSSTVATVEGATAMARLQGERWSRPIQMVEATLPQRGDLDYRDIVLLRRAQSGVSGPYRVAGWDLVMRGRDTAPAEMTVRMAPRQWT